MHPYPRPWQLYDLREFGSEATLTSAALTTINAAIATVNTNGGGVLWAPRLSAAYVIDGFMIPRANVTLDFGGSDVSYRGSGTPMVGYADYTSIPGIVSTNIDANVTLNATQLTVVSTASFTAGDEVFVRLVQNAYDSAEAKWSYWATVVSIDSSTLMTLSFPAPEAMTKASTSANHRVIYKVPASYMVKNWELRNVRFLNDTANGGNAARVVSAQLWRNCHLGAISAYGAGSGIANVYHCQDCTFDNLWLQFCELNGNSSKGRALSFANAINCRVGVVRAENFEGRAVFVESYCRNLEIGNMHLLNTNAARVNASVPLLQIGAESDVRFGNVLIEGTGGTSLVSEGASAGTSAWSFDRLNIQTTSDLRGGNRLDKIRSSANIRGLALEAMVAGSTTFPLTASLTDHNVSLPSGYYRHIWVYVSTVTGITKFELENTSGSGLNIVGSLSAGATIEATPSVFNDYGSVFLFNTVAAKRVQYSTDGTLPAGSTCTVRYEYFPLTNDLANGRLQRYADAPAYTATNVTLDRSYDANATTLDELADVVGTLLADLRAAGVVT